jgi:hypothetical protein
MKTPLIIVEEVLPELIDRHGAYRSDLVKMAEHVFALFPMDSVLPMPGHEMSFIIHTTNALSDSRKASLVLAEKMTSERDAAREFLGRDLKEAMERVLTLELEVQRLERIESAAKTFRDATQEAAESIVVTRQQFLALTDWLTQQTVSYDLPNVRDAISRLCYLSRRLQGPNNGE